MYLKLTNNESRFYSPSKVAHYQTLQSGKVKINAIEKISQRVENLKREDTLLNFDIVEHFWQRMEEIKKNLNITGSAEVIGEVIQDSHLREIFKNLVTGNYEKGQEMSPEMSHAQEWN